MFYVAFSPGPWFKLSKPQTPPFFMALAINQKGTWLGPQIFDTELKLGLLKIFAHHMFKIGKKKAFNNKHRTQYEIKSNIKMLHLNRSHGAMTLPYSKHANCLTSLRNFKNLKKTDGNVTWSWKICLAKGSIVNYSTFQTDPRKFHTTLAFVIFILFKEALQKVKRLVVSSTRNPRLLVELVVKYFRKHPKIWMYSSD